MSDVIIFVQARVEARLLYAQSGLCIRYAYFDHHTTNPLLTNVHFIWSSRKTPNLLLSYLS